MSARLWSLRGPGFSRSLGNPRRQIAQHSWSTLHEDPDWTPPLLRPSLRLGPPSAPPPGGRAGDVSPTAATVQAQDRSPGKGTAVSHSIDTQSSQEQPDQPGNLGGAPTGSWRAAFAVALLSLVVREWEGFIKEHKH